MNATPTQTSSYPAWRTYSKAVGMFIPVVCAWWFSMVMLVPKLKEIWSETHFTNSFIEGTINLVFYIGTNFLFISIVLVAVLSLLEWRIAKWPCYRSAVMYTVVLLVVTGMFVFLISMLTGALIAAPALRHG